MPKEKNTKTSMKFRTRVYIMSLVSDFVCAAIIFLFISFFLMLRPQQIFYSFIVTFFTFIFSESTLGLLTNKLLSAKVENNLIRRRTGTLNSIDAKTNLYKQLMAFPIYKGITIFLYFMLIITVLAFLLHYIPQIAVDSRTLITAYPVVVFASFTTALITFSFTEKICTEYTEELIHDGIDSRYIASKKMKGLPREFFGIPPYIRSILYLFLPIVFANVLSFIMLHQGYSVTNGMYLGKKIQIIRIIISNVFYFGVISVILMLYYRFHKASSYSIRDSATEFLTKGTTETELRTSLADQIQYNIYLLDKIMDHYRALMKKSGEIGKRLLDATEDLAVISTQVASTSADQSSDVKEILSTMEDSNALSQNIANRISEVTKGTDSTKYEVSEAFYLLKESIQQMSEIRSSNDGVIKGIRNLADKIKSVTDFVAIIEDIADQTKIIAFNAELEAVSAGKDGKNFHIVSAEIKRLANNTMNSIGEIKFFIDNIQKAANSLIESSSDGTDRINLETGITQNLEEQFASIMGTSDETNKKTTEIKQIIDQQTVSFNQIVITLRQISAGIESFTSSTQIISSTVNDMKEIAEKLSNMERIS